MSGFRQGTAVSLGFLIACLSWSLAPAQAFAQDQPDYAAYGGENIPPPQPPVPDEGTSGPVTAVPQQFDQTLSPYGQWVYAAPYGWSWQPSEGVVGPDFQPYVTNGSWVDTDDGWSFQTDWSWGDTTFHYGRWYVDPTYGWLWLPGTQWAPAWVDWRFGGGFCGWAPLGPPGYVWHGGGHAAWNFVDARHFGEGRTSNWVVRQPDQIHRAFTSTTRVQNTMQAQGVHWNAGPRRAELASAGAPVQRVQHVRPQTLHVTAPQTVVPKQTGRAQPRTATVSPAPVPQAGRPTEARPPAGSPQQQARPEQPRPPATEGGRPPSPPQHAEQPTPAHPPATPPQPARPPVEPAPPTPHAEPPPSGHAAAPPPATPHAPPPPTEHAAPPPPTTPHASPPPTEHAAPPPPATPHASPAPTSHPPPASHPATPNEQEHKP